MIARLHGENHIGSEQPYQQHQRKRANSTLQRPGIHPEFWSAKLIEKCSDGGFRQTNFRRGVIAAPLCGNTCGGSYGDSLRKLRFSGNVSTPAG
jgi:hypothetical protein